MLASLLVTIEANPANLVLNRSTPVFRELSCMAVYGLEMDPRLRRLLIKSSTSDEALEELRKLLIEDPLLRNTISTTQAIDLISGGVKANALPERAWALVNHRIASQRFLFSVLVCSRRSTSHCLSRVAQWRRWKKVTRPS